MAKTDEKFDALMAELEQEQGVETTKNSSEKKDSEKSENTTPAKSEEKKDYSYPHEEIMEEESITSKDLPKDIKNMIITFNRKRTMAKNKKSGEQTFLKLQILSVLIGDKILTHLESDMRTDDGGTYEDGGGVGEDTSLSSASSDIDNGEGGSTEDPPIDEDFEEGGEVEETPKKSGIFGDILGGIFDY